MRVSDERGFTLMEVLVAIVALSVSLGAILAAFNQIFGAVVMGERLTKAVFAAEDAMSRSIPAKTPQGVAGSGTQPSVVGSDSSATLCLQFEGTGPIYVTGKQIDIGATFRSQEVPVSTWIP